MPSETFKRISRRSFIGTASSAALSLPFLDSLNAQAADAKTPAVRMAYYYIPIGVIRKGFFPGETDTELVKFSGPNTKKLEGAKFPLGYQKLNLTPTMEPLQKIQDKITLITGLDRVYQNGTDVHAQCGSCFLSSAAPYSIKTSAWPLDRTLDQLIADKIGTKTPFRSIEISCNSHKDNLESIHFDNISWYGTGHVAPSIRDPRKLYNRLFGTKESQNLRSITDLVLGDAKSLQQDLGFTDRHKFNEYFESVRAIEKQMDRLELMKGELEKVNIEQPAESYIPRGEYIRLMGDLMIAALQTGLTNVATMMIGPERWNTPFMFESLFDKPRSHHGMSHSPQKYVDDLLQVDKFHIAQFAYMLEKMDSIEEANGTSLLDNTLFTLGSGLGDGSSHQYNDLPIITAGSGGGRFKMGGHYHFADKTPLANLWLTQANSVGLNRKTFADSTSDCSDLLA